MPYQISYLACAAYLLLIVGLLTYGAVRILLGSKRKHFLEWLVIGVFPCGMLKSMVTRLKDIAMNKLQFTILAILLPLLGNATNVEWNRMKAVDAEVWDTGPLWSIFSDSTKLYAEIMVTCDGFALSASHYMGGVVQRYGSSKCQKDPP